MLSGQVKPIKPLDFTSGDADKQGVKEVITQTILGQEYRQFLNPDNGQWDNQEFVMLNC